MSVFIYDKGRLITAQKILVHLNCVGLLLLQLWVWLRSSFGRLADVLFVCLLGIYYMVAHVAVVTSIVQFDLPPIPSLVLAIEQVS